MLLYNKHKIVIKHKTKDMEYSITWKYNNKLSNYHVTTEKYLNGFLRPGCSREFNTNSLDCLENLDIDNFIVKAY